MQIFYKKNLPIICLKSQILPFFANRKLGILRAVNLLCAVNLLYKVLPKQFRGLWLPLFIYASFLKNFAKNLEFRHFFRQPKLSARCDK